MRPSQALSVLEDLTAKRKGRLQRNGVELSLQDNQTTKEVYSQWLLLLMDLDYLSLVSKRAQVGQIQTDMYKVDVFELLSALNDCVDNIRYRRKDGFKARLDIVSPHLWGVFKTSFLAMVAGDLREARRLMQAFSYMGRLSLVDIDLTDQCLTDYLATEQSMLEKYPDSLIRSLRTIVERWCSRFDPSDLVFGHGPGGVAGLGRTTLENKYRSLFRDDLINDVFKFDYYTGHTSNQIVSAPDRISQTIFVPKSYKTFRTISMEPATLMYLQQGVWRAIDRMVSSSFYLSQRIDFHDQTRNQKLARIGSLTRNYATIDLSAASDSVSWKLVELLFSGTSLYPYMRATRSTHSFLPDRTLIELKKFAPMGSALCFPIETIIFAAICEHSCRKVGRVRDSDFSGDFSVFGDDIIVPTEVTKDLVWSLGQLGFTVNSSKSFFDKEDWYRESCGAEYCDGFDVTPLRVSRSYRSNLDGVALTGCVDLSNACYEKGFSYLRAFFIKKLSTSKVEIEDEDGEKTNFIPLFSATAMLGDNFSNWHTERRISFKLQRKEALVTVFVTNTTRGAQDYAYRHWLEMTHRRETVHEAFISKVGQNITEVGNHYRAIRELIEVSHSPVVESEPNPQLFKLEVGKVVFS